MFELQTVKLPELSAALGAEVELRELSYGTLRRAMAAAESDRAVESVFVASLHIAGEPMLDLDALDALPGRFSGALSRAFTRCLALHGMAPAAETTAANDDDDGDVSEGKA